MKNISSYVYVKKKFSVDILLKSNPTPTKKNPSLMTFYDDLNQKYDEM